MSSVVAVSPAMSYQNPGDETKTMRQWAYFPHSFDGHVQCASPQTFILLVESTGGRMAIATLALRTAPDLGLASGLARILDERRFELASRDRINSEFKSRHCIAIDLVDVDLDKHDLIQLTAAIPRALAQAAMRAVKQSLGTVDLPALRKDVLERIEGEWIATRMEFISRLNPEAVAQSRVIDGLRPSSYSYLNSISAEHRRNRAQAMAAFPLLRPVLMTPRFDSVRKEIDAGRPLIDVLAAHYHSSKGVIRALLGVTPEDLGHRAGQLGTVVGLLREIPPDWWPRDPVAWRRFATSANTIATISRHPITTATNQLWLKRCAQNGYQPHGNAPEDLVRLGQEIDEFMDTLRRALYWVLHDRSTLCSQSSLRHPIEIAASFRASLGLEKLINLVRRFGDAYRRAATEFAEEANLWRGVRWPAIGAGPHKYGDIHIHPLQTPTDLYEEGVQMGNCVARYAEHCMKGISQIWSVRLGDGTRLSTLETRIRTQANGIRILEVHQHKGVRNITPTPLAWQAARAHVKHYSESPEKMLAYLTWKQTVSTTPLEARQRHALMQPIITAFERTLSGQWSWRRLIDMGTPSIA